MAFEVKLVQTKTTKGTVVYSNHDSDKITSLYISKTAWPGGAYPPAITVKVEEEG